MKTAAVLLFCLQISLSYAQADKNFPADWTLVESNNLYGIIDNEGNEIIKPKYEAIGSFGEYRWDWALVERGGLYGFIDDHGEEVVKPKYDRVEKFDERIRGLALVEAKGKYGFIDDEGNEVVKPTYDNIDTAVKQKMY